MSSCSCRPDAQVSVTFVNGTVLLRCLAHETHSWLVDGRPVTVQVALNGLRSLFVEARATRGTRQPARSGRVISLPEPAPAACSPSPAAATSPTQVDDEALTALLNSRGLTGSWAVA